MPPHNPRLPPGSFTPFGALPWPSCASPCYDVPMKKQPEKTARTKQEFIQAFWSLYAETPVNKITVAQVCERAGYHRNTFYLHFHDVYELLEDVESALLEDVATCVENCMKRLTKDAGNLARIAALKDVVLFYERNKRFIVVLLGPQGDPSFALRLKEVLKPLWKRYVIDQGESQRSEQEINLILEFTLAGSLAMISQWLQEPQGLSAYELGHLVYDTAIKNAAR